jgi:hypothetical protein
LRLRGLWLLVRAPLSPTPTSPCDRLNELYIMPGMPGDACSRACLVGRRSAVLPPPPHPPTPPRLSTARARVCVCGRVQARRRSPRCSTQRGRRPPCRYIVRTARRSHGVRPAWRRCPRGGTPSAAPVVPVLVAHGVVCCAVDVDRALPPCCCVPRCTLRVAHCTLWGLTLRCCVLRSSADRCSPRSLAPSRPCFRPRCRPRPRPRLSCRHERALRAACTPGSPCVCAAWAASPTPPDLAVPACH